MHTINQAGLAADFWARHKRRPVLLLPNAWDPPSARLFEAAGFEALATTSGGVAWSLGYPDGEHAPWSEVVAATRRIVRATRLPVSADIEAGYGETPEAVGARVAQILDTGIVGINLEDSIPATSSIRSVDEAAARIHAARSAAERADIPLVINARTDLYHLPAVAGEDRYAATLERCRAYIAAGADCVYPFGLSDPTIIAALTAALGAPVNVTGRAGMPDAAALEQLGVARITIASAPTLVAMSAVRKLAEELRASRRFDCLTTTIRHPDMQKLFARTPAQS
jgi:2-methylisocitrate lyase-like PEP mutase family enzyme